MISTPQRVFFRLSLSLPLDGLKYQWIKTKEKQIMIFLSIDILFLCIDISVSVVLSSRQILFIRSIRQIRVPFTAYVSFPEHE